jgi:hypothetical protein
MATTTEGLIWERLIEPNNGTLSADATRYILSLRFPQADIDRVNELSAKARAGTLTEEETHELDGYIHVEQRLAAMKSKARQ